MVDDPFTQVTYRVQVEFPCKCSENSNQISRESAKENHRVQLNRRRRRRQDDAIKRAPVKPQMMENLVENMMEIYCNVSVCFMYLFEERYSSRRTNVFVCSVEVSVDV